MVLPGYISAPVSPYTQVLVLMAYSPTLVPAASRVTVGATAVDVNIPAGFQLKLGALILQRAADADVCYWGLTSGVLATTGILTAKGAPGVTSASLIPKEAFDGLRTFYLISGGTAGQLCDVVLI